MKQLFAIFAVMSLATTASANLIVYDGFDYDATGTPVLGTPSTVAGALGEWTSQGNTTVETRVTSGSLSYPGLPASIGNSALLDNNNGNTPAGANASRLYIGTLNSVDTPTVYYAFIASLPSSTNTSTGGAFFAGFDNLTAGAYTSFAGLFVRRDATDTTKLDLGISTSGSANKVWSSTAYSPDQPRFVIASFTFGGVANLDVFANNDPIPGTEPVAHSATTSGNDASAATSISNFYLRGNITEPQHINIDEVRVGIAWADMTTVPEPVSAGLLATGAIGLLLRRRRRS